MYTKITRSTYKDQRAIIIEGLRFSVKVLPDSGAGISSILDKKTGREFLVQRSEPLYKKGSFDGNYVEAECSGMDDMFPTIDACYYDSFPWEGVNIAHQINPLLI